MKKEGKSQYRELFAIVLPIAVQNFMTSLVSASDAVMLGFLSQDSLSAVSLATQITFVYNLFISSLTIGATVLAAQYWGKNDKEAVERILAIVLRFSMAVSLIFFAASMCTPGMLMRIYTNEPELIRLGSQYLQVVSWSYLCTGVSQIVLCIMKNSGRTLRSTIYGTSSVLINFVLNALFIYGLAGFPKLEIRGAALATVLARLVELFLVLLENNRKDVVRIRLGCLKAKGGVLQKDMIHYTAPVMANMLIWGCGTTMFSVIIGRLGSDAVAANSIASIVKSVISCVCLGIGTGAGILVGNELGRGNLEEAKELGGKLCRLAAIAGAVSGLVILVISPLVLMMESSLSEQSQSYLKVMLFICSYYMIGKSVNSSVVSGIFCAGGDTKFGLWLDLIVMWGIIVPLGLAAAFWWKLPVLAVYFLLNLDEFFKLAAVYRHYKKYLWVKNLTREEEQV